MMQGNLKTIATNKTEPEILSRLREELRSYRDKQGDAAPLENLGIYSCYKPQELSAVSILQPTMLLIITGCKQITMETQTLAGYPGELLLIPSGTTFRLGNYPDEKKEDYQGLALRFSRDALRHFRKAYGSQLESWDISARWHARAPKNIIAAVHQWLQWCRDYPADPQLIQHRQVELLLLLAQAGLAGNLLLDEHPSWRRRVSQLLALEPARAWQVQDICNRLGVSESSLRRRLQDEHSAFREILEEVRLAAGLSLLWETFWPISRIAEASGYQSQSRFSERFKRRYGVTPSELRRTRITESSEDLAVSGA